MLKRVLLAAALVAAAFLVWLFAVWPPPLWYRTHWPSETAFMRMRRSAGADVATRRYRPVPLTEIPSAMQQAVLVGEDNRFYEHGGIDFEQIRYALGYPRSSFAWGSGGDLWAMTGALGRVWERRDRMRGASTITQQLAKNIYLSPSRNPLRKVKEAVTAYRLEAALGKHRIMELYLNVVELGADTWGVEAASRKYFDRPARRLTRSQAAALAATLPHPLSSNPGYKPGRMRWRQRLILQRMGGRRAPVVPKAPEASIPPPPAEVADDSGMRALLRSLRAPIETLPPAP